MDFHSLLRKAKHGLEDLLTDETHSHTHDDAQCHDQDIHAETSANRYGSFAPPSTGHAKWYVDGASYFWAVSMALEGNDICFRKLVTR
jgi:phospholipase D1/2